MPAPLRISDLIAATSNRRTNRSRKSSEPNPNSSVAASASGITARTRRHPVSATSASGTHAAHARPSIAQKTFVNGALFRVPLKI